MISRFSPVLSDLGAWRGKHRPPIGLIAWTVLLLLVLIQPVRDSIAQDKTPIYFFSSETNINNFKSLKMEFDSFLHPQGPYEFQPFSDRNAFENYIADKDRCLLLTSSWHFRIIREKQSLIPVLCGVRDGKHLQKRLLVGGAKDGGIQEPVASASSVSHTRSLLKEIFPSDGNIDTLRILTVPKDIDALMSVGFQMAKTALVTENALDSLDALDPVLRKRLVTLGESKPSRLLIISVPEGAADKCASLIRIVRNMPRDSDGMNVLKMLDLDGWEPLESKDL